MEERVQIVLKKYFLPDEFVKSIFHISPQKLKERNVKGIITDLDNTLVEWDRPSATPRLIEWFQEMKDHGIQVTIVSNNNEKRVKLFLNRFIFRLFIKRESLWEEPLIRQSLICS